ncbi:TorF family putative porin [Algibacillus agarilyticus]|uniref:TorF family putative porin n=1 Tax=Algibacillus agarilyticus TaxID=2234133 RepID=UPI000DCFBF0A|nr:TorF family putative porin [Algibacillus agarilyticus]
MKLTSIAAVVALTTAGFASTSAMAVEGLSANVGATTNYLWRGVTQTDKDSKDSIVKISPAIQGGLDYAHDSGAYAGVWASNVDFGSETNVEFDWYFGYAGEAGSVSYDVGYVEYVYLDGISEADENRDFSEIYGSVSFKEVEGLTVGLALLADSEWGAGFADDKYLSADYEFALPTGGVKFLDDVSYAAHVGIYSIDGGGSYNDINVTASKSNFTLGLSKASKDGYDGFKLFLSYGMDFDLSDLSKKFK